VLDLNHPVPPFGDFQTPYAFWVCFTATGRSWLPHAALFGGGAGKARARRQVLPLRRLGLLAYGEQVEEQTLMANADVAASVGVELFIVDLGWARAIGDWYEDLAKFPHGLAALSYHVHSLGMSSVCISL